ncbi:M61 family metallopeptidase [Paraferrimonas haliotis]|uniref:M61 family metallopeptidase n=1 Tax=Paraferrimonas haliotis TaxID=2013866 RepID=UPI000BA8F073|nr:M61 family metallopeptidase [Paraferrimonas haliotis]
MIHYRILPVDPSAHLFEVSLTLPANAEHTELWLPSWIPGSYMIRDFCRNLINVKAYSDAGALDFEQTDKQTFVVAPCSHSFTVSYQVYAWDLSVRSAHLDQTHGFFNGTSVFLAVKGSEDKAVTLTIDLPEQYPHWKLASSLTRVSGNKWGGGTFKADNFDELIDHPVEMGELDICEFSVLDTPHALVINGKHKADTARICADLAKICQYQIELFGGQAPFDSYLFLTTLVNQGFGGLEHRASTALICSRSDLIGFGQESSSGYTTFLSLCSHEYFHSWNVKRLKPAEFVPYQLQQESYTKQLWAYEGITSYYDDWILYRCGLINAEAYLDLLAQTMTRVMRGSGRFKQTLRQSSFNAWTKFYKQDENAANAIVSYYTKGAMFALLLDLAMIERSEGQVNLDTLLSTLYQDFALQGLGTLDDSHQTVAEKLCGCSLADVFAYLDSCDDLPLAEALESVGVTLSMRSRTGEQDKGGRTQLTPIRVDSGMTVKAHPKGVQVVTVSQGEAAHLAGLAAGDVIIALDNEAADGQLLQRLQHYPLDAALDIHWFRDELLMQGKLAIKKAPQTTVELTLADVSKTRLWLRR